VWKVLSLQRADATTCTVSIYRDCDSHFALRTSSRNSINEQNANAMTTFHARPQILLLVLLVLHAYSGVDAFLAKPLKAASYALSSIKPERGGDIGLSMGSDALQRPEDENSPEFKEYLKMLLKMQANRARTGHGSPSSGSSDAYIAKLSRLKVEKIARFRAGLPDEALDLSYKPEDYAAAV
jgi:hypothetical protein